MSIQSAATVYSYQCTCIAAEGEELNFNYFSYMKEDFNSIFKRFFTRGSEWIRSIYIVAFNIYAWFWIYRLIFIQHSTDWEQYLLWFFTTAGMYFFVFDNKKKVD